MAFLDKLTAATKAAADKTGNLVEIGKLNVKISTEQNSIGEYKNQLGELLWQRYLAGEQLSDDAAELCASITAAQERIRALQAEIQALKDKEAAETTAVICTACGASSAPDAKFCSGCGAKL